MKRAIIFFLSILCLSAAAFQKLPSKAAGGYSSAGVTAIPLTFNRPVSAQPAFWLASGGIPFPQGALQDINNVKVVDAQGKELAADFRPLAWWSGKKSIKWLFVELECNSGKLFLEFGPKVHRKNTAPMKIESNEDEIRVYGKNLKAVFSKKNGSLLKSILIQGKNILTQPIESYVKLRDLYGERSGLYKSGSFSKPELSVEANGILSTTVLIKSWHQSENGLKSCPIDVRVTVFKNADRLKFFHTLYISENPTAVMFRGLGVDIQLQEMKNPAFGIDGKRMAAEIPVTLYQDNDQMALYPKFNEFDPICRFVKTGTSQRVGRKSDSWFFAESANIKASVILRNIWQEYPKGFQVESNKLRIEFWPQCKPEPMDLRRIDQRLPADYQEYLSKDKDGKDWYNYNMHVYHRKEHQSVVKELNKSAFGTAKSHEFWLDLSGSSPEKLADAVKKPVRPFLNPVWNSEAETVIPFHPEDKANFPLSERSLEMNFDSLQTKPLYKRKHFRKFIKFYERIRHL